ncbi:MAG: hypothetical protein FXF49_08445 [Flexistipes sinusarabici]|uniref:Capsule polysaccharide biosynthesis protein n=1 Tax=Flexistipes sinusarabici TaxID=2352 RepID=A0A5D0MH59_FLESI|nr:hypothetical protein [Flexistipes sinusarabici]TYB33017.1 MAG: hypothetical protein FXF49_08445 [Flexistipes sinusarabici]
MFNQKIQGVYFWKLIRIKIFLDIATELVNYGQPHTIPKQNIINTLGDLFYMIFNSYIHGVYSRKNKKEILIFESGRKTFVENNYIDIYISDIVEELKKSNSSYEIVDKPVLRKRHFNKSSGERSYYEHMFLSYVFKRIMPSKKLSSKEKRIIRDIEVELKNSFSINFKLHSYIKNQIKIFKLDKTFYVKLLKKRGVKKVFLVCSYGKEALIQACKEKGIECIELQHGTMGRYHLGYSFPIKIKVPYFPDKIYVFGKFWYDTTPLPLNKNNIIIKGNFYFNNLLKKYKELPKINNQIVFISQGTIGYQLSIIAFEFAMKYIDFHVIFKLHPGEFGRWQNEYPRLCKAIKLKNFTLIDNQKRSLHEVLAKSQYQVGVSSTAIFEGLALSCKTIIVSLPGYEYMDYLLHKNFAVLARNSKEILLQIQKNNFVNVDIDYYFSNKR